MRRDLILALTLAAIATAAPLRAEADFTFRRIAAPATGTGGKRITVQIAIGVPITPVAPKPPESPSAPDPGTAGAAQAGAAPTSAAFAWYWDRISPDLSAAARGRFQDAVDATDAGPTGQGVAAPRLQTLQGIAEAHGADILQATIGTRVSPALVLAVIAVESGGNPAAVSKSGAQGLMQLMPDTATRFHVAEATDPVANIKGGTAYLDWLMGQFGDDAVLALAGYNAGEGAVKRALGVPDIAETRGYVPKVLAAWKVARGLCLTPPELPSDGCVFVGRTAWNG